LKIRKFTDVDYEAIVAIRNSLNIVWPAWPTTPNAWRETDRNRDPKCAFQRWVAEEDGRVVGAASRGRRLDDYHPQKFYINIEVPAKNRNRGIGAALFDRLMEDIQPFDPHILRTDILENQIQSYPFVQKRGFREVWRETPVHLKVNGFDPAPYAGIEDKLHTEGIAITNMRTLEGDPGRDRKVYDLYMALYRDVPSEYEEFTLIPYEDWAKMCLQDPTTDLEGFLIVTQGDRYIALHELCPDTLGKELLGSLMGTLPEFRGRQIGLALMVRAITFARQHNLPVFKTCTAVSNQPMQSIFNRLGFGRDPEWLQCQKDF
jgi:GNAT superfamily N-acetyltransferase